MVSGKCIIMKLFPLYFYKACRVKLTSTEGTRRFQHCSDSLNSKGYIKKGSINSGITISLGMNSSFLFLVVTVVGFYFRWGSVRGKDGLL